MSRATWIKVLMSAVIVCSLIPGPGHAQVASTPRPTGRNAVLGYLGISNVRCNCTFMVDDDDARLFSFRSNPVVIGIYEGSPADGSLERGDTITAIDGYALTSSEGGRRFANIRPGQRLTLNVSRGRAHMTLRFRASSMSSGDERAFGNAAPEVAGGTWVYEFPEVPAIPATPAIPPRSPGAALPARPATPPTPGAFVWGVRPRRITSVSSVPALAPVAPASPVPAVALRRALAPIPPVAPLPPVPSPAGWFGFSIRCNECGWSLSRGEEYPVWESTTAPELSMISRDGPAARAGLMAGDRITHINGVSILSPLGARSFGRVRPGQSVRLTVIRDGASQTRELTLATRPEVRAAIAAVAATPRMVPDRRELRYTGQLDNVSVEVWSAGGPTVERVGDTMTITVGASVIRLKVK
ncbi:MAG: PDZ domain-containing protein [Gemmatimonadaceae bacterium]